MPEGIHWWRKMSCLLLWLFKLGNCKAGQAARLEKLFSSHLWCVRWQSVLESLEEHFDTWYTRSDSQVLQWKNFLGILFSILNSVFLGHFEFVHVSWDLSCWEEKVGILLKFLSQSEYRTSFHLLWFFWVFQVYSQIVSFHFPCGRHSVFFFLSETACYLTAISSCAARYCRTLHLTVSVACDTVHLLPAASSLASEISKCSFTADGKSGMRWDEMVFSISSYLPVPYLIHCQHYLNVYNSFFLNSINTEYVTKM